MLKEKYDMQHEVGEEEKEEEEDGTSFMIIKNTSRIRCSKECIKWILVCIILSSAIMFIIYLKPVAIILNVEAYFSLTVLLQTYTYFYYLAYLLTHLTVIALILLLLLILFNFISLIIV